MSWLPPVGYAGEWSIPKAWDWPAWARVFVGGCVARGPGSRFRAQAHAHDGADNPLEGWICVLSVKRLTMADGVRPSRLMMHELAHLLSPGGHTDAWRVKMRELGQPIPERYRKHRRSAS